VGRARKKAKEEDNRSADDAEPSPAETKNFFALVMKVIKGVNEFYKAIVAIIAVGGMVYGCVGHTNTDFTVLGTDGDSIILKVSFTGPKLRWSRLSDFRVSFDGLPIEDAKLKLIRGEEGNALVSVLSPGIIHLTAPGLRARCRIPRVADLPDRYEKDEIVSQIPDQSVALTISVHENGGTRDVKQPVQAALIKEFIVRHLPDHVPDKTSCS